MRLPNAGSNTACAGSVLAGALCAGSVWGARAGMGVAAGAALSWMNYRWMRQGVDTLSRGFPGRSRVRRKSASQRASISSFSGAMLC